MTTRRGKKRSKIDRSWLTERFLVLWRDYEGAENIPQNLDAGRNSRMVDIVVVPGKVVIRVDTDAGQRRRIEVTLPVLSDAKWNKVYAVLIGQALFFAKLLAGELPPEIEAGCVAEGIDLFPATSAECEILEDGEPLKRVSPLVGEVLFRVAESFSTNPFSFFQLLGRGREECLWELRKRRTNERREVLDSEIEIVSAKEKVKTFKAEELSHFWDHGPELNELTYTIKADEFPDALLKWLDPMPLGGLEDELEGVFEESYIQIARRAQAFGLGL